MNRRELIEYVSNDTGIAKSVVSEVVISALETVMHTTSNGEKVMLQGFGTFDSKVSPKRVIDNDFTDGPVEIPAKVIPRFKFGKVFKEIVAN